ncbi:MAG: ABC transporter permease, partial [Thiomicrospira sp.]
MKWLAWGIILLWLWMALSAFFVGDSANEVDLTRLLASPDWTHWLGYDELGRPLFERLLLGAQTSLFVALGVVTFSALIGTSIGIYSGYVGGRVDGVITKIIDVFLAFPGLLLAIALAAVLGPGIENVIFALVAVG